MTADKSTKNPKTKINKVCNGPDIHLVLQFVGQLQIHGGNLKLKGHVTSSIFFKNSSMTKVGHSVILSYVIRFSICLFQFLIEEVRSK